MNTVHTVKPFLVLSIILCIGFCGCGPVPQTRAPVKPAQEKLIPAGTADIQALIDNAHNDSTVMIPLGIYCFESGLNISERKNLTLTAPPGTWILVQDPNADILTVRDSFSITVENLYMRHTEPLEEYECHGAVIRLQNTHDTKIINCELNGCGAVGVSAWNSRNINIANCYIHENSFNALYMQNCDDVRISNCRIENNANLLQLYKTHGFEMRDNLIRNNGGYWENSPQTPPGLKE